MTPNTTTYSNSALATDMLVGAKNIANFTGKTERQTNYLLESGQIPAFKIGRIWHMRRSTFLQFIEQQEAAARTATQN